MIENTTPSVDSATIVATDEVLLSLKKGKKLHDHFAEQFRKQYRVANKLMSEWKEHFRIQIPPDLNPQTCKSLDIVIMEFHQEASFFKAEAEARLSAYNGTSTDRYRVKFAALVAEYKQPNKKLPAAATLKALAEDSIGDLKNATIHAEIELAFWKEVLSDLANSRKLIENATINLGIEAKTLQQERYFDSLNSKGVNR